MIIAAFGAYGPLRLCCCWPPERRTPLSAESEGTEEAVRVVEARAAEGEPVAQVQEEQAVLREVRQVPPELLPGPLRARPVLPPEPQQRPLEQRQEPQAVPRARRQA
jgi:hypothetical protein